jgi:hypothetical protein
MPLIKWKTDALRRFKFFITNKLLSTRKKDLLISLIDLTLVKHLVYALIVSSLKSS